MCSKPQGPAERGPPATSAIQLQSIAVLPHSPRIPIIRRGSEASAKPNVRRQRAADSLDSQPLQPQHRGGAVAAQCRCIGMTAVPPLNLRILNGDLQGQLFPVQDGLVIGRATTCAVIVPDGRASREHLRLNWRDGRLFACDLASHNGSFINGLRTNEAEVRAGDVLRIGRTLLSLEPTKSLEDGAVRIVSDVHQITPHVVRPPATEPRPALGTQVSAEAYLESMGVSRTISTDIHSLQLLRKTRHFAILVEVSRALQRHSDLHESLPGTMDLVLQVLRADVASIVLLDDEGRLMPHLQRERVTTESDDAFRSGSLSGSKLISKTVADMVLKDRCAVITANAAADERFAAADSIVINNLRSLMVVPVLVNDAMLGFVEVENRRSINAFDETDLHFVSVLGSMIGIALNHLRIQQSRELVIQELQAARDQLLATQQRLLIAERMGTLGRLASGIAHEVKNHLSPLLLADLIAHKYPQDQEICEASDMMIEAQRRILGLVDEIRQYAAGGRGEVRSDPCDLAGLVEGVVRFIVCDRSLQGIRIDVRLQQSPIVFIDAGRMRQVIINLIRNASESMRGQGTVTVEVAASDEAATVTVIDQGPGIPVEVQSRIFEPFFTTKGEHGLGLGLDISRQIVRAHGGSLGFTTELGKGSKFSVTLPLYRESSDVPESDPIQEFQEQTTEAGGVRLPSLP